MIRETAAGVEIDVRVIPRARKTALGGVRDDALVVRLAAPPVEGAANEAIVDYFAALLRLPRRAVRIVSGERGRRKRIALAGVTAETVRQVVKAANGT
ncbi:MAG: hypothetical protein DMF92_06780 [Acidobacteria bacterium]|nr:MAG: hypothetical protein DMF92_06780 [Acidobacteriota bacterium]